MKLTRKKELELKQLRESRCALLEGVKKDVKRAQAGKAIDVSLILDALIALIETGDQIAEWNAVK
jgi:hypothetical protein